MNYKLIVPVFPFLFAEDTIAADTEAAVFIPEIWANRALGQLRSMTCMASLAIRDYEDEIATKGDTVNVQKRGTLVTNDKVANTAVTLQNPTATNIPVILTDHKEVSFLVEDVAEAQANQSVLDGYVDDAAIVLGESIDLNLLGQYANVAAGRVINITTSITHQNILDARTIVKVEGKCGIRPRYLVIKDLAELLAIDQFVNADYVSEGSIQEGAIGKLEGFQVFENDNVISTVSPTHVHRLAFARGAIALITRRLPDPPPNTGVQSATIVEDNIALRVIHGYNMSYLGMQVTLDILFGSKIMRSEWIAEIS